MAERTSPPSVGVPVSRERARKLVAGEITPAEFLRFTQEDLYRIAQIGYELLNSGRLDEAKDVYRGLVAADPRDSVFHCHLAAVHHRLGELDQALDHYSQALAFNKANVDALSGRGELFLMRNQIKESVSDFSSALILDPDARRPATTRARALMLAIEKAVAAPK